MIKVKFIDRGYSAKNPPNPAFPDGVALDIAHGNEPSCMVSIPYPAPRCGYMAVECDVCGQRNLVSVAGRADDPRSLKMACYKVGEVAALLKQLEGDKENKNGGNHEL